MSGKSSHRAGWGVLLLAVGLLALGSHFVGECVIHTVAPASDGLHPEYDLAEDQFILNGAFAPTVDPGGLWGAAPLLQSMQLASLAPPAPPPDS